MSTEFDEQTGNVVITFSPDSYRCCICGENIIDMIITCVNKHSFCKTCGEEIKKRGPIKCPLCRSTDVSRNFILEKAVSQEIKKCDNKECEVKVYKNDMKQHVSICKHTPIVCVFCGGNTTTNNLIIHSINDCLFLSDQYIGPHNGLKSDYISNCVILAEDFLNRYVFITKDESKCSFLCVDSDSMEGQTLNIEYKGIHVTRYTNNENKSQDVKILNKDEILSRTISLPIHNSEDLINKNVNIISISLEEFKTMNDLKICGIISPYYIGSQWLYYDCKNNWTVSTVVERLHAKNSIVLKIGNATNHLHTISMSNPESLSSVLKPIEIILNEEEKTIANILESSLIDR